MLDLIESEAFWDVLKSANKLLSRTSTKEELLSTEKALCLEIRCIAAALCESKTIGTSIDN
jgi:hypothetical protein